LNVIFRQSYNFVFLVFKQPVLWTFLVGLLGIGYMLLAFELSWNPRIIGSVAIFVVLLNWPPSIPTSNKDAVEMINAVYDAWEIEHDRLKYRLGLLRAYGAHGRTVWVADSFKGFPPLNLQQYPADADADPQWHLRPQTESGVEHVRRNFKRYDLLDDQVKFLPGWFRDTLPKAPIKQLAVLRLDGDLYESTMDALVPLYPKVTPGGFVIIDDYNLSMCQKAVHDYRKRMGINEEIIPIDDAGAYWRKTVEASPKK
jgi:macrocin-O-methyltransferase TylF-like protien